MCGINGFIVKHNLKSNIQESCIKQMNAAIFHRGPDDSAFYLSEDNSIALGMQLL